MLGLKALQYRGTTPTTYHGPDGLVTNLIGMVPSEYGHFFSPSYPQEWPADRAIQASCQKRNSQGLGARMLWTTYGIGHAPPEEERTPYTHLSPDPDCSCGIYATTSYDTVMSYGRDADKAIFLIEGLPRIILGESGWRAGSARVVAVVRLPPQPDYPTRQELIIGSADLPSGWASLSRPTRKIPTQNLVGELGCQYFGVDIWPLEVAFEAIRINNARFA